MNADARPTLSLMQRLLDHAVARGGEIAYRMAADGHSLTYRDLVGAIAAFSERVRAKAAPRSVLILSASNRLQYPVAFLGILAAGCSVFPVAPEAADAELLRAAQESRAAGIIGDERAVNVLGAQLPFSCPIDHVPLSGAGSPASTSFSGSLLLQSSGTTGLPKIVRRSGRSLDAAGWAVVEAVGLRGTDGILMTVPLTHSYGLEHGLLAPLWAGSAVHLAPGLELRLVLAELARGTVTILPGVPSTFEMLSRVGGETAPTHSLRLAYSAGAPLPAGVRDAFERRFGAVVTQLYGASEIGSVTYNPPAAPFEPASVGPAMPGVSICILSLDGDDAVLPPGQEGQVAVKAASMFDVYLDSPAGCIDGHFPTGDLGRLDDTGRLFITGRIKLLIDVGGLKVNPLEVEAVLQRHPAVGSCVVVAVRQSQTVFRLKAVITPSDPAVPVPLDELRRLAREQLAAYKAPRLYEVRPSLPRSAAGKVLRHLLEVR